MATKTFEEYTLSKETDHLDVKDHCYRAVLSKDHVMVTISFDEYVDAERAGFTGYMAAVRNLPAELIVQIAEDIKAGKMAKGSR